MNIGKVEISQLNVALNQAISTPLGTIDAARNVVVKIITDNGIYGWGEASPFAPITGDSQESNYITAQQIAKLLVGKDALAIDERMTEINKFTVGEPSIRSAFDMALYDLAAKAANMPLYQFLGGSHRELRTDLTIGMKDTVEQTVQHAKEVIAAGFNAIKMKVGRPNLEDVAHVKAVRELVGEDIAMKIDSNQGWDYPTAVANIKAMAPLNLEYSEQPLAAWDYDGLATLRKKVDLPICADESVFNHHDALKLVKLDAVDYLNIKLGKAGGIHTGLKINAIAEAAQIKCMVGCFAESRLGLSAAAHFSMAKPNIYFIDLDSSYEFKSDPVIGGLVFDDKIGGLIHLPESIGHGADIDVSTLENTVSITS